MKIVNRGENFHSFYAFRLFDFRERTRRKKTPRQSRGRFRPQISILPSANFFLLTLSCLNLYHKFYSRKKKENARVRDRGRGRRGGSRTGFERDRRAIVSGAVGDGRRYRGSGDEKYRFSLPRSKGGGKAYCKEGAAKVRRAAALVSLSSCCC